MLDLDAIWKRFWLQQHETKVKMTSWTPEGKEAYYQMVGEDVTDLIKESKQLRMLLGSPVEMALLLQLLDAETVDEGVGKAQALQSDYATLYRTILAIQEWAKNLKPSDGIEYGSYWPAFAVNEALRKCVAPRAAGGGDRDGT